MTIRLLMLGKNKDRWVEEAVTDFVKRMKGYCDLELVYLKDEKVHDDVERVLKKEAETIEKALQPGEYLVVLDDKGRQFDSEGLHDELFGLLDRGVGKFAFLIGSAHGLAPEIKEKADLRLSLSSLTMNHQVVRIIFLEQLYRVFTIRRGMKYHK